MTKAVVLGAFALLFGATSSFAEIYECDFSRGGGTGWISNKMYFKIDATAKEAWVQDGLTQSLKKGWYDAQLKKDNAKRFSVAWKVDSHKNSSNQRATLLYSLTYLKTKNGKTTIQMKPMGYDNTFNTGGVCKLLES